MIHKMGLTPTLSAPLYACASIQFTIIFIEYSIHFWWTWNLVFVCSEVDLGGPYGQFYLLFPYCVAHQCKHDIVDSSTHAFWIYGHMYTIGTQNTYIRSEQHASSPQSFLLWNLHSTAWLWGLYWAPQHSTHRCTSSSGPLKSHFYSIWLNI